MSGPQPWPVDLVAGLRAPRRAAAALVGAATSAVVVGVPTVVIPNPVFGRALPVTWWSYPVLFAVSALSGLLIATYVRVAPEGVPSPPGDADPASRRGALAGALSFFAVGCPVCNKVVLLALGASGAVTWFAPVQPLLALMSVAGLLWALRTRVAGLRACAAGPSRDAIS